jgi:hypothetical protein
MIQEEDAHYLKSISETHININIILNISLLLKELTVDNIFSPVEKPLYQLVMFFQSTESHKVPPSAISNLLLVIKEHIQDVQVLMPPLLDTQMMVAEPESDFHLVQEKLFQVFAEQLLVSLLVEEETKNQ